MQGRGHECPISLQQDHEQPHRAAYTEGPIRRTVRTEIYPLAIVAELRENTRNYSFWWIMRSRSQLIRKAYERFYASHHSVDALLETANSVCSSLTPIYGCVFTVGEGAETLLGSLAEGRRRIRGFRASGRTPYLIEVPVRQGETFSHGGTAKSFLWPSRHDSTVVLMGLSEDFQYLWTEMQKYLRTTITQLYLRTQDFRDALLRVSEDHPRQKVRVTGYTANVLCDEGRRVKTRREWLAVGKPQDEFFDELEQETQWLRSLEVVFTGAQTAHARIRRDMSFSCRAGLTTFYKAILESIRITAAERAGIFQNRAVADSPTHASRPIQITYKRRVFKDKSQNQRLIRVLGTLADSALSVFHANPFLHASLVDYSDGSSYTIWVTDNSAIALVPELKATPASLARLCNHINEHFDEGIIEELSE
jgi:hypothetical protein